MSILWFLWEKSTQGIPRKTKMAPSKGMCLKCVYLSPPLSLVPGDSRTIVSTDDSSASFLEHTGPEDSQGPEETLHTMETHKRECLLLPGIVNGEVQYVPIGMTQTLQAKIHCQITTQTLQFTDRLRAVNSENLSSESSASRVMDFCDFSSCDVFILLPNCDMLWLEGEN